MSTPRFRAVACAFALLLPAALAVAGGGVVEKPVAADSADKFQVLADNIRNEMKSGGRYEFIKAGDRSAVESDFDGMAKLLAKSGTVAAMNHDDQLHLYNLQEHVNGLLTHSDSNRLVCERHAPVGTNIPQTTCRTVGEIERTRLNTNAYLQNSLSNGDICRAPICATAEGESRGSKQH